MDARETTIAVKVKKKKEVRSTAHSSPLFSVATRREFLPELYVGLAKVFI